MARGDHLVSLLKIWDLDPSETSDLFPQQPPIRTAVCLPQPTASGFPRGTHEKAGGATDRSADVQTTGNSDLRPASAARRPQIADCQDLRLSEGVACQEDTPTYAHLPPTLERLRPQGGTSKTCHSCRSLNISAANWCTECGTAINTGYRTGVDTTPTSEVRSKRHATKSSNLTDLRTHNLVGSAEVTASCGPHSLPRRTALRTRSLDSSLGRGSGYSHLFKPIKNGSWKSNDQNYCKDKEYIPHEGKQEPIVHNVSVGGGRTNTASNGACKLSTSAWEDVASCHDHKTRVPSTHGYHRHWDKSSSFYMWRKPSTSLRPDHGTSVQDDAVKPPSGVSPLDLHLLDMASSYQTTVDLDAVAHKTTSFDRVSCNIMMPCGENLVS